MTAKDMVMVAHRVANVEFLQKEFGIRAGLPCFT
jgi:hypothetical protein